MARGRPRPSRLLGRGRQVRGWPASRGRHRPRWRPDCPRAGGRRGDVRRHGADARAHSHDHDLGRVPRVAHASWPAAHEEGGSCRRGRSDRGARPFRRAGALGSVRPSGSARRRRPVRRPALTAPVAECHLPSAGSRGAARASSSARTYSRSRGCRAAGLDSGLSRSAAGRAPARPAGSRFDPDACTASDGYGPGRRRPGGRCRCRRADRLTGRGGCSASSGRGNPGAVPVEESCCRRSWARRVTTSRSAGATRRQARGGRQCETRGRLAEAPRGGSAGGLPRQA